jgi:hypothetical protein
MEPWIARRYGSSTWPAGVLGRVANPHPAPVTSRPRDLVPDAELVWVLDPIDGTRAFVAGLPLWTTLIGLRHEGRPMLGSICRCPTRRCSRSAHRCRMKRGRGRGRW